ncbi:MULTISPECIES: hypothetical protein [unclassified Kitasatospora]
MARLNAEIDSSAVHGLQLAESLQRGAHWQAGSIKCCLRLPADRAGRREVLRRIRAGPNSYAR